MKPIYLDYAATSPVDPRVLEKMIPWFSKQFGNAASRTHAYGNEAENAVKLARKQVADLIGAKPEEIVFTSGSTEGINLIIKGLFDANQNKGNHIITAQTEHKAVLDTCQFLESKGASLTYLDVDADGLIDLKQLEEAITDQTILVSIMYANNETGVIQQIKEIAHIAHKHNVLFMSDASQAIGKIKVNVVSDSIDLLVLSGHKFYGPKGVGAVFIKQQYPKIKITPLIHGGGHERGYRSGTLNVPCIVGLGHAALLAASEMVSVGERLLKLKNAFESELLKSDGISINGHPSNRLPNISNVVIDGIDAEALIITIRDELAIANGSACTSADILPSHVLKAMQLNDEKVFSSVRFSFGKTFDVNQIKVIIDIIALQIKNLKSFTL